MTALVITLASLAVYLFGYVFSAAAAMKFANLLMGPRCHMEDRQGEPFRWSSVHHCKKWCEPGCWRMPDNVTVGSAAIGSIAALVWPLLVLPFLAYKTATRTPAGPSGQRIADLERELDMGA